MRLLVVVATVLWFYARDAHGRNETIHACELVIKCFQDAESELMQCQNIITLDFPASNNGVPNEVNSNNETISEPTTPAPPSDDCMVAIKQKIQQKKILLEQRAQAFALCLSGRMERGPEDVDPRKHRYCNTVITRYNARTTLATPPEFTLLTTPVANAESTQQPLQQRSTIAGSSTIKSRSTQQPGLGLTGSSAVVTTRLQTSINSTATRSAGPSPPPRPPPLTSNLRPRRQIGLDPENVAAAQAPATDAAVFAAAAASNGSIIRPPAAAAPPGKRQEATTTTTEASTITTAKIGDKSTDPFDVTPTKTSSVPLGPKSSSPESAQQENDAGRIGAVARFSSNGQSASVNKDQPNGQPNDKAIFSKNSTSIPQATQSLPLEQNLTEGTGSQAPPEAPAEANQIRNSSTESPQDELQRTSPENVSPILPFVSSSSDFPNVGSPPAARPPGVSPSSELLSHTKSSLESNVNSQTGFNILQENTNSSNSLNKQNETLAVLVQQEEQAEVGVVQTAPLDQPLVEPPTQDFNPNAVSPPSGPSPPGTSQPSSSSIASTTASLPTTSGQSQGSSTVGLTADEKQRNRAETLRESRRRVSEFKACMARARIKREECKPLVNCCPDTVKCHLRYELSELHDQIHRLELEISEGRQACIEKKKAEDRFVDAMDQIDEEDLISDESIVSQQVF